MSNIHNRSIDISPELEFIAQASFGRVYKRVNEDKPWAYKTTLVRDHDVKLVEEFESYRDAYAATQISPTSHQRATNTNFVVPRPMGHWQPETRTGQMINEDGTLTSIGGDTTSIFPLGLRNPTLLMEFIPSLDERVGEAYKALFFSDELRGLAPSRTTASSTVHYSSSSSLSLLAHTPPTQLELSLAAEPIRLLRLYLGRIHAHALPDRILTMKETGEHRNGALVDLERYEKLRVALRADLASKFNSNSDVDSDSGSPPAGVDLPLPDDVCRGMGEVLARLHWGAGMNCRDIELVLGGSTRQGLNARGQVQCYVLDFNQSERWLIPNALETLIQDPMAHVTTGNYAQNDLLEATPRFAILYSVQELYYPRPHQVDLYLPLKQTYLSTIEGMMLARRPNSSASSGIDQEAERNWTVAREKVMSAARAFFEKFEQVDKDKMARRSRRD